MTGSAPAKPSSLPEMLDHFASVAPHREAACDRDESLSYAALRDASERVAARLHELGIRPGDRLAFMGTPGLQFWVFLLGSMRTRAAWVGLNPLHTTRELTHVLEDSSPRLCLVGPGLPATARDALELAVRSPGMPRVVELAPGVTGLIEALDALPFLAVSDDALSTELHGKDVCLVVYTSGSTGSPKGALLTARGLVENGWWLARRMEFHPLRGLVNLPVNHVGCIGDLCSTILAAGGTAVFMERFDPVGAVRCIVDRGLTWLGQVPAQFQLMIAKGGLEREHLAGLRYLLWGGAAMPEPLVRKFAEWVPDILNGYGLTECSGTITLTDRGASLDVLANTVGRAVDPALLRIADERDRPVPVGHGGEIQLRGSHLFAGYLNQPEASRSCWTSDGWFRTGDLAELRPDGNVQLLGRTGEMFKSGGYNVYPREVENVVESLAGVELCAVIGVPDPLWDEVGVAYVQGDPAVVTPEVLARHCAEQLARYKVPKRFVVRASLPLLPIGKVDKQRLRREFSTMQS